MLTYPCSPRQESLADAERSAERTLQLTVLRTSAAGAAGSDSERSRGGHRDIEVSQQLFKFNDLFDMVNFLSLRP